MIDHNAFNLTPEQEFLLASAELNSRNLSEDHVKELLLQVTRLLMVKDNIIKELIRRHLEN